MMAVSMLLGIAFFVLLGPARAVRACVRGRVVIHACEVVCVRVRVRVCGRVSERVSESVCVCVCVRARARVCV